MTKSWQDYATNVQPQTKNKNGPSLKVKIWRIINIMLTALCILALHYGFNRAAIEHSGLIGVIHNTALTFYLPGMIIAALLTGHRNFITQESMKSTMIWSLVILNAAIIINAILASIFYYKHRHDDNSYWRINCVLAIIPAIFVVIADLNLFLPL